MFGKSNVRSAGKRRLLLAAGSVAAVAAIASLVGGITFARLSATTPPQTNKFTAGTVTITSNATSTCNVTNMLPGTTPSPCTLAATYSGKVPAYLGLDVLIAAKAGTPGTIALYNPSDPTKDLQITITDNQSGSVTYITPATNFGTALSSCPTGSGFDSSYTCYQLNELLASTTPFTNASSPDTFSTAVSLPNNNPTGYQGGKASVVLTVHAVQSANQTMGTCTAGNPCTSIVWG